MSNIKISEYPFTIRHLSKEDGGYRLWQPVVDKNQGAFA